MTREIIEAIESCQNAWIGIRHLATDEVYQVGDYCRPSYDWNFENDCSTYETDEPQELPGTCAYKTGILIGWDEPEEIAEKLEKALEASNCYMGEIVIIAGNSAEYGNDNGEIIIKDAIVLAKIA
ncbi:hypothetical protein [Lacrimispora sp.]|uniref:hypothetical protein n=1 Tax=Lacrimispora sp. TaxID=2719234 RepID=UPI00345FA465